jgi:hypothetical protein
MRTSARAQCSAPCEDILKRQCLIRVKHSTKVKPKYEGDIIDKLVQTIALIIFLIHQTHAMRVPSGPRQLTGYHSERRRQEG